MAIAQLVYPSDLARKPESQGCECGCGSKPPVPTNDMECQCNRGVWLVPAPPPMDYPPYPYGPDHHHHHHHHDDPDEEPVKIKTKSIEAQICKLSKRSAAIKAMLENYEVKNKDAILKIGATSYNFGPYYEITKDGSTVYKEETEYAERIKSLLTDELEAIKEKLQELASELDSEDNDG